MRLPVPTLAREALTVRCADGWELRGELVLETSAAPVAVALVGHAMMVDRRTLDRVQAGRPSPLHRFAGDGEGPTAPLADRPRGNGLVSHLASRGLAVIVVDLRGHGASGPRADEGGDWSYDDLVEQDCAALLSLAAARFPSLPVVAVGHSLFGHVMLAHAARHRDAPLDGLVLIAGNVANPGWSWLSRLTRRPLTELMGLLTGLEGHLPVRRLRLGSDDEARGYVDDFVRWGRSGEWRARDGFDYWRALPTVTRPVLAIVGAGDHFMAPEADARALVAPLLNARLRVVGRRTGLSFDPGHMSIVLDERARPVWNEIAEFVRACRPNVRAVR
jgi:predicted alpha/beta hydrolase